MTNEVIKMTYLTATRTLDSPSAISATVSSQHLSETKRRICQESRIQDGNRGAKLH